MKALRNLLLGAFFLAVAPSPPQVACSEDLVLQCKWIKSTPVIDGNLNESCWKLAERASGFWLLEARGQARWQSECMVAYDSQNLYIAFRCHEDRPENIVANQRRHDGPLWQDDCVEVYLDIAHDHQTYYHLISNSLAARFDEFGYAGSRLWNPDWQLATRHYEDYWTVELALPFSSMGISAPYPGTVWGFNVARQKYRPLERSSWAETYEWFHEPAVYGHLRFLPFF